MPTDYDQVTSSGSGRASQIDVLTGFLGQREAVLVDKSIEIAKSHGYAPFTTTIRAAWVEAIVSVTEGLGNYLARSSDHLSGPRATLDYANDPRFARMRQIARQHRSLGITLQMYVGLFKHFRNLYLAELDHFPGTLNAQDTARVRDFFDETELSISADWHNSSDNHRLRELQERARAITLDKDRYFSVFESLRNPAFLLDRGGNLVNANQASAELFLGQDAQAGEIIYLRSMRSRKSSLKSVIDQIMNVAQTSEEPIWLDTLDGSRCFDIRKRVLHDAVENTALGHVVLLNDVTAHHRKAEQAQQSERGMSRFLATMSHEIRTPLHSILGAAELLRTADHDSSENYLDVIEGASKALLLTLSNVLDYSKFENHPPVPRPTDTDLVEEIRAFGRIAVIGHNALQARLSFDIAPDVPKSAHIDWGMTQQVLSNLVSNALKADEGGGIVVRVSRVSLPGNPDRLRIEVSDHGPGIPESAAAALVRPFERTTARDTGNGGSGLGLAISHHLVEAMGGRIGYTNQPQGAIVWFDIPLHLSDTKRPNDGTSRSPSTSAVRTAENCLLVDDDLIGAIVTIRQLERLGLRVTHASTVEEARSCAAADGFDVFVVDYLLPDGDGPSLVGELRAQVGGAARFLALTANVEALVDRADTFDEVLAKPVGQVSLASAIFGSGSRNAAGVRSLQDDLEGLQGLAPETITAMIDTFADAWREFRTDLAMSRADDARESLALQAHRLAGSSAILGLHELEPALRKLEAHCLDGACPLNLIAFAPLLDRDLQDLASWQRLSVRWAAQ